MGIQASVTLKSKKTPVKTEVKIEPSIDLSFPEDVLIQVDLNPRAPQGWMVMSTRIISGTENVMGAASYEEAHSGFLHYVIKDMLPPIKEAGFYVVEGINAYAPRGESWSTDDDLRFFYQGVRKATPEEISLQ